MNFSLDIATIFALIAILVVVFFNSIQYWQMKKQLKNTFFAEYTKRYQEIALHFPLDIYEDVFSFDNLGEEKKERVRIKSLDITSGRGDSFLNAVTISS